MNEEKYLKDRLEDQLGWYEAKSKYCQNWYKGLRLVEILFAALIPFLSGVGEKVPYHAWIIGGLGVVIAVAAGASSLSKFHENWIQYRTTAEQLKHEKYLYITNVNPYDLKDKFPLLVQRVEGLISKENSNWAKWLKLPPKAAAGT